MTRTRLSFAYDGTTLLILSNLYLLLELFDDSKIAFEREREGGKVASASFRFLIAVCQDPRDPREKNGATATEAINNGRNYVIARRERERERAS